MSQVESSHFYQQCDGECFLGVEGNQIETTGPKDFFSLLVFTLVTFCSFTLGFFISPLSSSLGSLLFVLLRSVAQVNHLLLNIVNFFFIVKVNHLALKMNKNRT